VPRGESLGWQRPIFLKGKLGGDVRLVEEVLFNQWEDLSVSECSQSLAIESIPHEKRVPDTVMPVQPALKIDIQLLEPVDQILDKAVTGFEIAL
jgi:hypothetical protein